MKYDSREDTLKHIEEVRLCMFEVLGNLSIRAGLHDESKLEPPEKEAFDECSPLLKEMKYGSDEYKAALARLGPALQHHYEHNRHHPEHYKKHVCIICFNEMADPPPEECPRCLNRTYAVEPDICGMSLLDLIEMLCDWKAAQLRHDPPGIMECSMELNKSRFKIPPPLGRILENTAREMMWMTSAEEKGEK